LSVDASQATEIDVVVAAVTWKLPGIVGACVSAAGRHALVGELTVACAERLPAALRGGAAQALD
jgi:hypothetical protein